MMLRMKLLSKCENKLQVLKLIKVEPYLKDGELFKH